MGSAIIAELEVAERGSRAAGFWHVRHLKVGMLTREQCLNIYYLLTRVIAMSVPGDVVELGCHEGGAAMLIQRTLDSVSSSAHLHVYDSFAGLPPNAEQDRMADGKFFFPAGTELLAAEERLLENFRAAGLRAPEIHKGWFRETLPQALPERICFAHLDGDLYSSITESLEAVYPRLSTGAIVVIDDYCDPQLFPRRDILPGVRAACADFFANRPESVEALHGGTACHGYFVKR